MARVSGKKSNFCRRLLRACLGLPLEFGAGGEKSGGAEGVPIGETEAADSLERLHGGGHAGSVEAERLGSGLGGLGKIDPDDAGGVIRARRQVLFLREHGANRGGCRVGIGVEGAPFFDLDDAVLLQCGKPGVGDDIENRPLAATAQARTGAADGHDGNESAGTEDFER